ncbi:MAG: InlB B-repeat-containing protein [Deltaproteobacteria bacterium]
MYKALRCLLMVFVFLMICSIPAAIIEAAEYKDVSNHWAKADIEFVSGQGIIAGYSDGTFQPDKNVTRAEYIAMINRALKLTATMPVTYSDVKAGDWYAADISKAKAAGYIAGYSDGTIRPGQGITRQEAAVMIAKAMELNGSGRQALSKYQDNKSIASWCSDAVAAVIVKGYLGGYPDNTFRPNNCIKRAEAAVVMRAVCSSGQAVSTTIGPAKTTEQNTPEPIKTVTTAGTYNQAGIFGPASGTETVSGDGVINVTGVTLRNLVITGDLTVAKSVGSGSVTLNNITVNGKVFVYGGGPSTVILDGCVVPCLVIDKDGVRVMATGSTNITNTNIECSVMLEEKDLSGNGFEWMDIKSSANPDDTIELKGNFNEIMVSSSVHVTVSPGSSISNLVLDSAANVTGAGSINNVYIEENGEGAYVAQYPGKTSIVDGVTANVGGSIRSGANAAPRLVTGYPNVSIVRSTYCDISIKTNKNGIAYYIALPNDAGSPTPEQVKSGTAGNEIKIYSKGSVRFMAGFEVSARITDLFPETEYDIYIVTMDDYNNLQASVTKLDITTASEKMTRKVTITIDPEGAGTVIGSGLYEPSAKVTLTAMPSSGWTFANWTLGGQTMGNSNNYDFNMPDADVVLQANFEKKTTSALTVLSNGGGGTVTGSGVYAIGSTVTITAIPAAGYAFCDWTCGSMNYLYNASFDYTVTADDTTWTANFVPLRTLNVQCDPPDAAFSLSGAGTYHQGGEATISIIPNAGYLFDHWSYPDGTVVSTNSSFNFMPGAADCTLIAHCTVMPPSP